MKETTELHTIVWEMKEGIETETAMKEKLKKEMQGWKEKVI